MAKDQVDSRQFLGAQKREFSQHCQHWSAPTQSTLVSINFLDAKALKYCTKIFDFLSTKTLHPDP